MTEVDKVFQIAAHRIQGLTAKVNYWKQRANELEAALGTEKAARIEAEATRDRALNAGSAMRDEIARLRADLRTMSERSNGSEWEKKAAEIEELRAELSLVKQERDCAKSEWDRAEGRCKALGEEVADLFSDRQRLKAELAVIKDERDELRAKVGTECKSLSWQCIQCKQQISGHESLDMKFCPHCGHKLEALPCEPRASTPRSHPVKVGEWVRRVSFCHSVGTKIGTIAQVLGIEEDGDYTVAIDGTEHCWSPKYCTPCDPPEVAHDTPAQESPDIKVGDYVEVFQDTGSWTRRSDIGVAGKVSFTNGEYCHIPQGAGYYKVNLCDVRRIQREPKPGDVVRLVNTPVKWESEWGDTGDIGTVDVVSSCDDTVRIQEAGYWWSIDRIEIVDAE